MEKLFAFSGEVLFCYMVPLDFSQGKAGKMASQWSGRVFPFGEKGIVGGVKCLKRQIVLQKSRSLQTFLSTDRCFTNMSREKWVGQNLNGYQ